MNRVTIKLFFKEHTFSMVWLLVLFVILNMLTRFLYLPQESIYGDEGYSIFYAQQQLSELKDIFLKDQNPPLHIIALHFWMKIFGVSDVSAKGMSAVASILCAVFLFFFSEKFLNRRATIIVSVLYLLSNIQIFYSHEVRAYAIVQMLCVASFYFYFSLIRTPSKKWLFGLALINLLLIFTHYLTVFIFVVQFLCIWMYVKRNRKGFLYYFVSQLIVVLLFLPWLGTVVSNLPKNGSFWLSAPDWADLKWFLFMLHGNAKLFFIHFGIIILAILVIMFTKKYSLLSKQFDVKIFTVFLILYILPIALDYCISQYTPVFQARYFLYSSIGLYLLIAYIFGSLHRFKSISLFCLTLVLIYQIKKIDLKPDKGDDWKHTIPIVKQYQDEKTVILVSASYKFKEFSFYYDRGAFIDYINTIGLLKQKNVYCSPTGNWGWEKADFDKYDQVIFVQSHSQFEDPEGNIKKGLLQKKYKICHEISMINLVVTFFKKENLDCPVSYFVK